MLDKPIEAIVYDDNGQVCGVTSQGETAKAKMVIGDPSYFPDKVKKQGQVIIDWKILNSVHFYSIEVHTTYSVFKNWKEIHVATVESYVLLRIRT